MENMVNFLRLKEDNFIKAISKLAMVTFLLGCQSKAEEVNSSAYLKTTADTFWSAITGYSITPYYFKNGVVHSTLLPNKEHYIQYRNDTTGELIWEWNDYLTPIEFLGQDQYHYYKDRLLISDGPRNYCIDLNSGRTLWKNQKPGYSGLGLSFIDDSGAMFQALSNQNYQSKIFKTDITTGQREEFFVIKDTSMKYEDITISPISFGINSSKENVVICVVRFTSFNHEKYKSINSIYCISKISKQLLWQKNLSDSLFEILPQGFHSTSQNTYGFGFAGNGENAFSISNDNGNINWIKQISSHGALLKTVSEKLILISHGSAPIMCLNPENGKTIWQAEFQPSDQFFISLNTTNNTLYHEQIISSLCSKILLTNINTGQKQFTKPYILPDGCLARGVAINSEKKIMYVGDWNNIIAYKLPKEIK